MLVPERVDPVPQTSLTGRPLAAKPLSVASMSSLNSIPERAAVPVLVIVYVTVFVVPAPTMCDENDLANVANAGVWMTNSASAASEVKTTFAATVSAVTVLVVPGYPPDADPPGVARVAEIVQLAFAASVPPVKLRVDVPDNVPPHWAEGRPVATKPLSAASKLSVKAMVSTASDRAFSIV